MIKAVGFDIDGTLYKNYKMYIHTFPSFLKKPGLVKAFGKVRKEVRKNPPYDGEKFRDRQAAITARLLGVEPEYAAQIIEDKLYSVWVKSFRGIKPFPGVEQLLFDLQQQGIPLGVLSDFPVEKKLLYMGIDDYFKVKLCAEDSGRLKPDPRPFLDFADKMGHKPEDILFVGNSYKYDIIGAKKAGMQCALIVSKRKKRKNSYPEADFIFSSYRELATYLCKK
jgi:putative hydrolase of the HAD superfamily